MCIARDNLFPRFKPPEFQEFSIFHASDGMQVTAPDPPTWVKRAIRPRHLQDLPPFSPLLFRPSDCIYLLFSFREHPLACVFVWGVVISGISVKGL